MDNCVNNDYTLNDCIVKEEIDLDTNYVEENNGNNVLHKTPAVINFGGSTSKTCNDLSENLLNIARMLQDGCQSINCKLKFCQILKEQKQKIFDHFWSVLNHLEKLEFISNHIHLSARKSKIRRQYFFKIDEKFQQVCQKTFVATLDINRNWIETALKKYDRKPDDSISHYISEVLINNIVEHQDETDPISLEEGENENFASSLSEENCNDKRIINDNETNSEKELTLELNGGKMVKKEPQFHESEKNYGYEFETIFLVNDSVLKDSENYQMERLEVSEEESDFIVENKECNTIELSDNDSDPPVNNAKMISHTHNYFSSSKNPCNYCVVCLFPLKHTQNILHEFWNIRSYKGKIQYIANCIEITKVKKNDTENFEYIHHFVLPTGNNKSKVCEAGFQNALAVTDDWIIAAMKTVLPELSSNKPEKLPNQNISAEKDIKKNQTECLCDDENVTNLWLKARRLKELFYNKTKYHLGQSDDHILRCEKECEFLCQMPEKEWDLISREFWNIKHPCEQCEYILNHIQIISSKMGKCTRKYYLKIDGKLKRVCRLFFLEALSIKNNLIEAAITEKGHLFFDNLNQEINFSNYVQAGKTKSKKVNRTQYGEIILPRGQRVRIPCDAYYHHNCRQILEVQRQRIFQDFWNLTDCTEREKFISNFVEITSYGKKKNYSLSYFMEINGKRERICQLMFEATLDINDLWIKIALEKQGILRTNIGGIYSKRKRALKPEIVKTEVKTVVKSELSSSGETEKKFRADDFEIIEILSDSNKDHNSEILTEEINAERIKPRELLTIETEKQLEIETEPRLEIKNETLLLDRKMTKFCDTNCTYECHLFNDRRQDICIYFWDLQTRYEKFEFISRHVEATEFMARELNYFLEIDGTRTRICQGMFMSTLDINTSWIHNVLNFFGKNTEVRTKSNRISRNLLNSRENRMSEMKSLVAFEIGMPYVSSKGTSHPGRELRERCIVCAYECKDIQEIKREHIFHDFWNISSRRGKYEYLSRHIVKGQYMELENYFKVQKYFFQVDGKLKEVCRDMFIATLDIDIIWIEKLEELKDSVSY